MEKVSLDLKDMYQLLVCYLRYGYTRNNHLMPNCAYDKVKELIPQMYKVDSDYAITTLKQICEECITDELVCNFYDGYDDEFGNRRETIDFINWSLEYIHEKGDPDYKPYCWDGFKTNLAKDDEPRYLVYEVIDGEKKLITPEPVSFNKYGDYIFVKENFDDKNNAIYHHTVDRGEVGSPNYLPYGKAPIRYEFISPTQKVYIVEHI